MNETLKIRICIFLHFSVTEKLPFYVQLYLEELSKYFDKVVVLSNNSKLQSQNYNFNHNVDFEYLENKGYDFGMFYRFIKNQNLDKYSQIAIVNDSNILLNKLEPLLNWAKQNYTDFWGLIDSYEKPWFSTHPENYHIQSHFIVLNENAIQHLPSFFESVDIQQIFNETDRKKLRRLVIDQWEIGLSRFMLNKGLKCNSFINSLNFARKHNNKQKNATHSLTNELIKEGYPLIKKKVVLSKSWRSFIGKRESWQNTISDYACKDWAILLSIEELQKVNK